MTHNTEPNNPISHLERSIVLLGSTLVFYVAPLVGPVSVEDTPAALPDSIAVSQSRLSTTTAPESPENRYTRTLEYEAGRVAFKLASRLAASSEIETHGKSIEFTDVPEHPSRKNLTITYDTNDQRHQVGRGALYFIKAEMETDSQGQLIPATVTRVAVGAAETYSYSNKGPTSVSPIDYHFVVERDSTGDDWTFELGNPRPTSYNPDDPFANDRVELKLFRSEAPDAVNLAADATHFRVDKTLDTIISENK